MKKLRDKKNHQHIPKRKEIFKVSRMYLYVFIRRFGEHYYVMPITQFARKRTQKKEAGATSLKCLS